jgi:hypothetical protein
VRNFLHDHVEAGVFDPDAADILVAAFDKAWHYIQASGARITSDRPAVASVTSAVYATALCFTWLSQI